jgi:hypothetical protein
MHVIYETARNRKQVYIALKSSEGYQIYLNLSIELLIVISFILVICVVKKTQKSRLQMNYLLCPKASVVLYFS